MNIFISADDKYIHPAQIMLTSFLTTNNNDTHNIYFMHSKTQEPNIQLLEKIVTKYNSNFIPIKITADKFKDFVSSERFPVEVYYRLLIASLLPETEERALWLDVDLLVVGPLDEFYNQELEGKAFAACKDIDKREEHLKELGCPPDSEYINSGVILFNLPYMRNYTMDDYYSYFSEYENVIEWPDQDLLNGMYVNKIKIWDCDKFNAQVLNWSFHGQYDLDEAAIIHYIGYIKPWSKKYTNSAGKYWDKYHAIAFNKGSFYLFSQKCHRFLELKLYDPLRKFIVNTYENSEFLQKIRNIFRR